MNTSTIQAQVSEILDAVKAANGRRRLRTISESDVRSALALRAGSKANVVRVWGGFVPNSYNGGRCACPVLMLRKDGAWTVYLGSCTRPRGLGSRFTECGC